MDDFVLRRGHRYGRILIDMATRRPIDMLTDRSTESLTVLASRSSAVTGAGVYAEAAAKGAPQAIQVAAGICEAISATPSNAPSSAA